MSEHTCILLGIYAASLPFAWVIGYYVWPHFFPVRKSPRGDR